MGLMRCRSIGKMEHDKTECHAPPEGPILCINNCGFFGSPATMNMCSKCHKDILLKQEQAKLVESSIGSLVNGSSDSMETEPVAAVAAAAAAAAAAASVDAQLAPVEPQIVGGQQTASSGSSGIVETKPKEGPNRCTTCKRRVGLMGFSCRCGNLFCGAHRYSDKHDCPFDYRTAARDAIAKANPLVMAEKLDKI